MKQWSSDPHITISGKVTPVNCHIFINGIQAGLTGSNLDEQVALEIGYNLITIDVRAKKDGTLREVVYRRAIRTGCISMAIGTPCRRDNH